MMIIESRRTVRVNNLRYLIEWQPATYEEWDDEWQLVPCGEIIREIFDDECEFFRRVSELEKDLDVNVIICGIYTCEITKITRK